MNILCQKYHHRAVIPPSPKNEPIIFKWHWPRGTFDKRMSAHEMASFIMGHMPSILPLLSDHPDIYAHWLSMLMRFITWPTSVLDEVVPWIKRLDYTEEDEILQLDLNAKQLPPKPITSLAFGNADNTSFKI